MASGLFTLKQQVLALRQGAWTNQKPTAVDYLVVAGGGGGGYIGGGGGAGGLLQGNLPVAVNSSITVTVGAGGNYATSGSNSVFGAITTIGGGRGGGYDSTLGAAGGSGGGGNSYSAGPPVTPTGFGQGIAGQGNAGGGAVPQAANLQGGGGGGAGTVGLTGTTAGAGNGGAGVASDISGTRTTYAGGGGGASDSGGVAGNGGAGGGGAGAASRGSTGGSGSANGGNGTANTGGGGGAYGVGFSSGSAGGSGIVIISYPDTYAAAASTTGSPTVTTSGSGSLSFNGSSQYVYTAANSLLALGSGSFTIEYWLKINGSGSFARHFSITGSATFAIECNTYTSSVTPYYIDTGAGQFAVSTGSSFDVTQWHHVAIVRNGTALKVYLNGVQALSTTDATNYSSNGTLYLAANSGANNLLNCNISNFRLVKGAAVYTSAFTAPTAPLTAVSGTSVLFNTTSGAYFADSSGNAITLTDPASTPWNSSSPFATGLGYKNRVYQWTSSGSITF